MLTVAQVIDILKTFPQDAPVTGYNGQEETDFVSAAGIRLQEAKKATGPRLYSKGSKVYVGPHVDIMGF